VTAAIGVAKQALRAGGRVRAQPWADVHGQYQPSVGGAGQRLSREGDAESVDLDPAVVDRVVEGAVSASMLGYQR
jgi:hypothetical protein